MSEARKSEPLKGATIDIYNIMLVGMYGMDSSGGQEILLTEWSSRNGDMEIDTK